MTIHHNEESDDYIEASDAPSDPAREPLPIELTADARAAGQRLDRYVASRLPDVSRSRVQRWIAMGSVETDGALRPADARLTGYERIRVVPLLREADRAFEPDPVPLAIVYEDADLLVLDKPAGLVVHPAAGNWRGTLLNGLLHHRPDSARLPRAGIVHRLDKDTSGLMVVARSEAAIGALVPQLSQRTMSRRYLALAEGRLASPITIDATIGRDPVERVRMAANVPAGKPARTHVYPLAHGTLGPHPVSLLLCRLETGRTHQIRVHLRHRGQPLVGDAVYGGRLMRCDAIGRQALHAWRLSLEHPRTRATMHWQSPLPEDLVSALGRAAIALPAALERASVVDRDATPDKATA